jgi:hypothetical protein
MGRGIQAEMFGDQIATQRKDVADFITTPLNRSHHVDHAVNSPGDIWGRVYAIFSGREGMIWETLLFDPCVVHDVGLLFLVGDSGHYLQLRTKSVCSVFLLRLRKSEILITVIFSL